MCIVYSKFLSNYSINQCQFLKILFHVKHKLLSLQFCKFFQDLSVFYLLRNRDELIQKKIYLYAQEQINQCSKLVLPSFNMVFLFRSEIFFRTTQVLEY
jgi:hypothetical protein